MRDGLLREAVGSAHHLLIQSLQLAVTVIVRVG